MAHEHVGYPMQAPMTGGVGGKRPGTSLSPDIIVVNYHSAGVLSRSLAAVAQFIPDPGVILVDNSPGDGSAEAALRLFPDVLVIPNAENRGFAAAVNQGVAAGQNEIVVLLNPDVTEIWGSYKAVEELFLEDSRLGAVAMRLLNPDGTLQRNCRMGPGLFDMVAESFALAERFPGWRRAQQFRMLDWDYSRLRYVDAVSGALVCIRRAAWDDVGPMDESFFLYYEETDWFARARERGWKTLFFPDVQAVHDAGHSSGEAKMLLPGLLLESQHRYTRKHFGRWAELLLRTGCLVFDGLRWARAVIPKSSRSPRRAEIARRVSVHISGRAPRPGNLG